MRKILQSFLSIAFLAATSLSASAIQPTISADKILLHSGTISTTQNFEELATMQTPASEVYDDHYYRIVQFNELPSELEKNELKVLGLELLNYLPYNAFFASIRMGTDLRNFDRFNIRTMLPILNDYKSSRAIREKNFPDYSIPREGYIDLIVMYYSDMDLLVVENEFNQRDFEVLRSFHPGHQVRTRIAINRLESLLSIPFVKYVEAIDAPSEPDDTKGRSLHRSNMINSDFATGLHYDGAGVSISLADDGEVGPHIDFTGRITNLISTGAGGSHGDMTSGIAAGGGNLNPTMQGMASGAHLYIHDVDDGTSPYDHVYNAPFYYTTYGAIITSTSYSQGCNEYNSIASTGDQIAHQNPHLNFVYSAGNRGQNDCGFGTGAAWGTITGGFKQGKNVIACGNLDAYGILDATSSRGPAEDGRVKPDICANGKNQNSTRDNNRYQVGGGTSAACPGIAGISAQLIQAYREMHSGDEAPSALIKSCMLNSAEDIGNPGPDYTYGWGRVNAYRALSTLQDNRYLLDSISNAGSNQHTITVPANVKQLKCMLYWLDVEGDPVASIALVNDLDLTVEDPSSSVFLPWILDPTPVIANLTANAVRGADHLNNMEQVTIDNPAAGNYTVEVSGTSIPVGAQTYFILWEFLTEEVTLTYPNGGEGFVPGETETLRWDAFDNTNLFDLDYSLDNGSSWLNIVTGIQETIRQFDWIVPAGISDRVLVRITRNLFSDESDAPLAIANLPSDLNIDFVCLNTMQLSWTAAAGATAYEVSQLGAMYMDSIGTTSGTSMQVTLNESVDTWFSVRALGVNNGKGRRAVAINKLPGLSNCSFADDLNLVRVENPQAGLLFPCQNLASVPLILVVRNDGINIAHDFELSYSINGGTVVTETYTDTLIQGASINYTFSAPVDLSTPGNYQIDFTITYIADANGTNNSINHQLDVQSAAAVPVTEDFQSSVFPPAGWALNSSGTTYLWAEKTGITGASGSTTTAAWFDNYSYNNVGARDYLNTFLADFTGLSNPLLTFDVAYAAYSTKADGLGVEVSPNCGISFLPTSYLKAGSTLASAPSSTSDWVPTQATHWRKDSVSLASFANSMIMLRFVNINDFGNNLYIDNINIENNFNPGIPEISPVTIGLYPNPSDGNINLTFKNLPSEKLNVSVYDFSGRLVISENHSNVSGDFKTSIDMRTYSKGIFMLRISNGEKVYMMKATIL
jgi:hypothetical protein